MILICGISKAITLTFLCPAHKFWKLLVNGITLIVCCFKYCPFNILNKGLKPLK